MTHFISERQN